MRNRRVWRRHIQGFGLAPVVLGINVDFASANGGESRALSGLRLSGATVTIDGTSATITANTAGALTFTVPASGVSTSDGNPSASVIKVTTAHGTWVSDGKPLCSLWYLPKYYGVTNAVVWTVQNATASGGNLATCPDLSGNG